MFRHSSAVGLLLRRMSRVVMLRLVAAGEQQSPLLHQGHERRAPFTALNTTACSRLVCSLGRHSGTANPLLLLLLQIAKLLNSEK